MDSEKFNELFAIYNEIEAKEAIEAGALGYIVKSLVQATLPHKKVIGNEFTRTNGNYTLTLMAPSKYGLPYGSIPRLLLSWITTEAFNNKSRELILGNKLSNFMEKLDLVPSERTKRKTQTGGNQGNITRLKKQMESLFSCSISLSETSNYYDKEFGFRLVDERELWWTPKNPEQENLFQSSIILSEKFYEQIISYPVPIDLRALKVLKRSPMALDIYCWLTYRMSYLKKMTIIPWELLQLQFGAEYKLTRQFKAAFLEQLKKVLIVYPDAKVNEEENGLQLKPSKTHILKNS